MAGGIHTVTDPTLTWEDDGGPCPEDGGVVADHGAPSTVAELIEALAAIEHERWADWQKWVHECGQRVILEHEMFGEDAPTVLALPESRVASWDRQINTPYTQLTEREKQSDRDQVMRYLPWLSGWDV